MIPEWAELITLADLVIAAAFIGALATAGWKAFSWLRGVLDRIEAKTARVEREVTKNGGASLHDRLIAHQEKTQAEMSDLRAEIAQLFAASAFLLGALVENHPGIEIPDDLQED